MNLLIGCTASGKGRIGLELARRLGGEIVSVDSMKIYRRMDIGTAKPSEAARREIRHHLIDVVEPSEPYSLARYIEGADRAIDDIAGRGKPVLAVGGTMLYVRGLTAGVFAGPGADLEFRRAFRERAAREGTCALHAELARVDPKAAARIHVNDLRRIERALEVYHLTGSPISELQQQWDRPMGRYDCRIAALRRPKEQANRRINARVHRMIEAGLVDEVKRLLAEPGGIGHQAAQAVGYAEIIAYLRGRWNLADAVERIKINSRHLAKHQRTWMRRIPGIRWVDLTEDDTVEEVADRVLEAWSQPAA
ncbi:MAG TPA: tRNA (adenosine(37)-N6)-dimethylallyltransferase MiaA [Phycisphaerae bacterium]|nr:tRNA (adenosine(37)-N6)-dimethylallyltransferase MiaA [Phycisphaerae bacterium]HRR85418.1 tRNA (adenosine(37)-N6)-dimethylallyltransferase MiaA [Phycisphaerae bacterium]